VDSSFKSANSLGLRESDESNELEALEDQQFRREMEEYDKIMAKAHQIAKSSGRC